MKCKICGYESNKKFSFCPSCGNKNENENLTVVAINEIIANVSNQFLDNREKFLNNKQNNDIQNSYIGKEIKFEDIKVPLGFNKDFIQKNSDSFTINAISGGEFFPNKEMPKIIITIIVSFIVGCNFINSFPEDKQFLLFFYLLFLGILAYFWIKFTNIKTKFNFSFEGINIHSRKGSLFIPKENIKDIYINSEETADDEGRKYIHYKIIFEFYQPIYIPYPKTNKHQVIFLSNFYTFVDEPGKTIVCYIVQEIKKALNLE